MFRRTLVLSDVHGAFKALEQVFERAGFDKELDRLIFLGDVVDGWPDVVECIEFLGSLKNLVLLKGNHDEWALNWLDPDKDCPYWEYNSWVTQGGRVTIQSIERHCAEKTVLEFLSAGIPYFYEDDALFVHGGIPEDRLIDECTELELIWDRSMAIESVMSYKRPVELYNEVFCGHTPTQTLDGSLKPIISNGVICMDTGASYDGPLSIMDINTKEVWQSDVVKELYPGLKAR